MDLKDFKHQILPEVRALVDKIVALGLSSASDIDTEKVFDAVLNHAMKIGENIVNRKSRKFRKWRDKQPSKIAKWFKKLFGG